LGNRIKFVPGIRYEFLENQKSGYINTSVAGAITDESRNRNIFLYGAGTEFKVTRLSNLYANYSRAYRPITFSELTPGGTTEIIDPNLKDASGFNADFGYRGQIGKFINFDVSLFYLQYHQRTGIITVNSAPYRTNIGTSASKGVESYIEVDVTKLLGRYNRHTTISFFASNSYINAKYIRWDNPAIADDPLKSIENKKVENAPAFIHRIGTTCNYKKITLMLQYNYTGEVYTDAANTETAPASANIGKLPAYQVIDATFSYRIISGYTIRCGVNNLTNEKYASRRASGYPGPGILPGNARTFFVTFGVKL
jgi:Fe(3+) dicitrate transport protein